MVLIVAHGLTDAVLPVPMDAVQLTTIGLVIAGHAAGVKLGSRPRSGAKPSAPTRVEDAPGRGVQLTRVIIAVVLIAALGVGLFGEADVATNPASRLLWSVLPAVLLVVTLVFGPRIATLNPLRRAVALADPETSPLTASRTATAIAVGSLAFLVWGQAAFGEVPFTGTMLACIYLASALVGAAMYGSAWFDRADPVEASIRTLALTHPARSAGAARTDVAATAAVRGVVAVLTGAAVFDSLAETGRITGGAGVLLTTLLLGACIMAALGAGSLAAPSRTMVPALVPIAGGYLAVHALGRLTLDVQTVAIQGADAFAALWGRNVMGEASEVLSPEALAISGAVLLLAGHLLAVVIAISRSRLLPADRSGGARLQFSAVAAASMFLSIPLVLGGD